MERLVYLTSRSWAHTELIYSIIMKDLEVHAGYYRKDFYAVLKARFCGGVSDAEV
jgi:hypothetical protein